jgi:hypothetical protein
LFGPRVREQRETASQKADLEQRTRDPNRAIEETYKSHSVPVTEQMHPVLRILVQVLSNLALVAFLAWWLSSWLTVPCRYPPLVSLSSAVVILAFGHSVWRLVGPVPVKAVLLPGGIKIELGNVASILDFLHPRELSRRNLLLLTASLAGCGLAALVFGPIPPEEIPVIDKFTVKYVGTDIEEEFRPGDLVSIQAGQQVLVKATILSKATPRCTWDKRLGRLSASSGCATLYIAPSQGTYDYLSACAHSPCRTREAYVSIQIKVVYGPP